MNIFDDLIGELKEENLLEDTDNETVVFGNNAHENGNSEKTADALPEKIAAETAEKTPAAVAIPPKQPLTEAEFYRQRALDEVAFLQIVEQVFAGVEREQLKIVPKPYNDLEVKKVLHSFLQFSPKLDSNEQAKAEFQLLQETESWHSSLTLRDERLTTAHLRRFCETSRPALSSSALVALARFYRNSPYSEPVRNKFDLIVTRLFSKEIGDSQRELIFSRDELANHLSELYAEWSSVPLYSTDTSDREILELERKFEEFMQEASDAMDFDDLIKTDFYTRLHSFKRSANENFYAPRITATGIECNIRVGNRYVELLENEKQKGNVANLEDRYGLEHDSAISEATAKTYSLIELLKHKKPVSVKERPMRKPQPVNEKVKPTIGKQVNTTASTKPNKWLIAATILAILTATAIYFGTKTVPANSIDAGDAAMKSYLQQAHVQEETLIGVVSPTWNQMNEEKRKDALKQMIAFGTGKNFKKIELQNKDGKAVATAVNGTFVILE